MAESIVSKTLRKDREIREARFGYGLAAWLFGIWGFMLSPNLLIFFFDEFELADKIYNFSFAAVILGIAYIAIRRFRDLGKLRVKLSEDPKLAGTIKVTGPPIINTIIPFILK